MPNNTAVTEIQHVLLVVQKQLPLTLAGSPSYETAQLLNPLMPKYIYYCVKKILVVFIFKALLSLIENNLSIAHPTDN